ncbi:uncharacterized protein BJ171DRAFT_222987 [Polychytrium aggregatum]|uniref:uncharacterized protein n=1 Tax=Polychytrium aggregatum TaxID=110093 RepID=UPI0022FDF45B|nr:uncharacterized protein BJ171DRAFT_222987 [Polychytrium aggregatum]KAI9197353.1 hypothetical protein BJ171DRAFT_222987 [Polychytrium aggregatum]
MSFFDQLRQTLAGSIGLPVAQQNLQNHPSLHFHSAPLTRLGLPKDARPLALCFDPIQSLLSVALSSGQVHVVGAKGIESFININAAHSASAVQASPALEPIPVRSNTVQLLQHRLGDKFLVLTDTDNAVYAVDFVTSALGPSVRLAETISCICTPALSKFVFVGTAKGSVQAIDTKRGELSPFSIPLPQGDDLSPSAVVALECNPSDSNILLVAYQNGFIVLWDLEQNKPWKQFNVNSKAVGLSLDGPGASSSAPRLTAAAWRPDGQQFAVVWSGLLVFWNIKDGWFDGIAEKKPSWVTNAQFSEKLPKAGGGGSLPSETIDGLVWSPVDPDNSLLVFGHRGHLTAVAVSHTAKDSPKSPAKIHVVPLERQDRIKDFVVVPPSATGPTAAAVVLFGSGQIAAYSLEPPFRTLEISPSLSLAASTDQGLDISFSEAPDTLVYDLRLAPPATDPPLGLGGGRHVPLSTAQNWDVVSIIDHQGLLWFWHACAPTPKPLSVFDVSPYLPANETGFRVALDMGMQICTVVSGEHVLVLKFLSSRDIKRITSPDAQVDDLDMGAIMSAMDDAVDQAIAMHAGDDFDPEPEPGSAGVPSQGPGRSHSIHSDDDIRAIAADDGEEASAEDIDAKEAALWDVGAPPLPPKDSPPESVSVHLDYPMKTSAPGWNPFIRISHNDGQNVCSDFSPVVRLSAVASTSGVLTILNVVDGSILYSDFVLFSATSEPSSPTGLLQQEAGAPLQIKILHFADACCPNEPEPRPCLFVGMQDGILVQYGIYQDAEDGTITFGKFVIYAPRKSAGDPLLIKLLDGNGNIRSCHTPLDKVGNGAQAATNPEELERYIIFATTDGIRVILSEPRRAPQKISSVNLEARAGQRAQQPSLIKAAIGKCDESICLVGIVPSGDLRFWELPQANEIWQVQTAAINLGFDYERSSVHVTKDSRLVLTDPYQVAAFALLQDTSRFASQETKLFDQVKYSQWSRDRTAKATLENNAHLVKPAAPSTPPKSADGSSSAFSEAQLKLNERGEKLEQLEQKFGELSNASKSFADTVREYNEKQAKKKWWEF